VEAGLVELGRLDATLEAVSPDEPLFLCHALPLRAPL